jgi:hypothetical protein
VTHAHRLPQAAPPASPVDGTTTATSETETETETAEVMTGTAMYVLRLPDTLPSMLTPSPRRDDIGITIRTDDAMHRQTGAMAVATTTSTAHRGATARESAAVRVLPEPAGTGAEATARGEMTLAIMTDAAETAPLTPGEGSGPNMVATSLTMNQNRRLPRR